jgi:hypothetical protein
MSEPQRLWELLPAIHRQRDAVTELLAGGPVPPAVADGRGPLQSLLDLVDEQVEALRRDMDRLYDNWFVETAEGWALAYIAELVGLGPEAWARAGLVAPSRADIANTVGHRRRKGTLALLEELARDVAGWPALALEYGRRTVAAPNWRHPLPGGVATVGFRDALALDRVGGPLDGLSRTAEVRRADAPVAPGRYGVRSIGLHIWRLAVWHHDGARSGRREESDPRGFSVSLLGNDLPTVVRAVPEVDPTAIAGPANLPLRISRRWLAADLAGQRELYGPERSLYLWRVAADEEPVPVGAEALVVADLGGWAYRPAPDRVAIDPERGRVVVGRDLAADSLLARFSTPGSPVGAQPGGCDRPPRPDSVDRPAGLADPSVLAGRACVRYTVRTNGGDADAFPTLAAALNAWSGDLAGLPPEAAPAEVVFALVGDEVVEMPGALEVPARVRMELAGMHGAPTLWRSDSSPARSDVISVVGGGAGSCLVLDNVVVAGRGIELRGDLAGLVVRSSTMVPGWLLDADCEPVRPGEASVLVSAGTTCIRVERSVTGPIHVVVGAVDRDPLSVMVTDSIVDGGAGDTVSGGDGRLAHVRLRGLRSTFLGRASVHEVDLVEDAIFTGGLDVARRQVGCVRFSYLPAGCRPPLRFHTEPDTAIRTAGATGAAAERVAAAVAPVFVSERFGRPGYGRLVRGVSDAIRRGAHDGSEMGAFHDQFEAGRIDTLRARLVEHSTAEADVGLHLEDLEGL